jgi:hypothetical protein
MAVQCWVEGGQSEIRLEDGGRIFVQLTENLSFENLTVILSAVNPDHDTCEILPRRQHLTKFEKGAKLLFGVWPEKHGEVTLLLTIWTTDILLVEYYLTVKVI